MNIQNTINQTLGMVAAGAKLSQIADNKTATPKAPTVDNLINAVQKNDINYLVKEGFTQKGAKNKKLLQQATDYVSQMKEYKDQASSIDSLRSDVNALTGRLRDKGMEALKESEQSMMQSGQNLYKSRKRLEEHFKKVRGGN